MDEQPGGRGRRRGDDGGREENEHREQTPGIDDGGTAENAEENAEEVPGGEARDDAEWSEERPEEEPEAVWRDDEERVFDERFIRDAEVKEPAARTRMLRERWRGHPPEPQPWRSDEPPAGWFFSKARRKARKRWRRKGR